MKNRLFCCSFVALSLMMGNSAYADEAPFVNASQLHSGENIGVAGFPALEVIPGPDEKSAAVVAREGRISPNITYSCSYTSPINKFNPTPFFLYSLYGYYSQPQWKNIKKVTLKFGGKTFSAKPTYKVQGPDRDRSADAQESAYFENLNFIIPSDVARQIANNNGVIITTEPATLYLPVSASAMDRWKQLVNSVDAISKSRKRRGNASNTRPRQPSKPKVAPGMPLTEVFDESTGMTSLQTEISIVARNFGVQGLASIAYQGKTLEQPFTAILVAAVSENSVWTDVESVTLSFGSKKLRLTPNSRRNTPLEDGRVAEALSVRVPYKDFLALAKSPKFYVTVGDASFEVNSYQSTGIRQLARRITR